MLQTVVLRQNQDNAKELASNPPQQATISSHSPEYLSSTTPLEFQTLSCETAANISTDKERSSGTSTSENTPLTASLCKAVSVRFQDIPEDLPVSAQAEEAGTQNLDDSNSSAEFHSLGSILQYLASEIPGRMGFSHQQVLYAFASSSACQDVQYHVVFC